MGDPKLGGTGGRAGLQDLPYGEWHASIQVGAGGFGVYPFKRLLLHSQYILHEHPIKISQHIHGQ